MKRCWIALLVAWLLVEGATGQAGPVESDGGYDRECLMAILPAVSYSCRDRATRGPAPVVNGSGYSLLYSQSTRTLLGGFFQYCTAVGLKRPLYYLLPPTSLSAVLVAAADSMAAPFAAFPGDRLQKNFTRAGSLDALEDALLGYVSARSPSADGLPYGYDSVITPFSGLQELRAAGLLTGLAGISSLDTLYQRGDIHPTMLDTVSYAGELSAVPLDGSQLLLYVRTELLAAPGAAGGSGGLRVPDSWEQLLAVAGAVNGSLAAQLRPVVNATGGVSYAAATAPVFGFCMQPHTHMLGALALAVLAPLVQTNGSDQGMYLNADTLRPAATTAAMPYVLSYLRRLAAYSAPVAFSARAPQFSNDFALGRCAMTVGTAAQFRRNSHAAHPAGPSAVIGRVTAALLPGSEFVVTDVERDWTSAGVINSWVSGNNSGAGMLRPCDARLCPASQLSAGSASSVAALGLAASPPSGASQGTVSTSSQALVNRAPLMSPGGTVGGVYGNNAEVMPQLYTWTMLSALGGPVNSWQLLLLPVSELGPWRLSHMDTADNALARWRAAGYSAADTASFLTAARATLDHHNVVLPLRVRTAMLHVRAVRTAALRLLNATAATPWVLQPAASPATSAGTGGDGTGATASSGGRRAVLQAAADNSTAMQQPQQEQLDPGLLEGLLASLAGLYGYGPTGSVAGTSSGAANSTNSSSNVPTREQMMQEYRRSLGLPYTPVTTTAGEVQSDNDSGSNLPVGAVVGAVVGGVLVAALAGVVALRGMRNRGRRRGRWRVVEPPGASPDTVLLVTDIEGSTSLWEALPEEVMDRALRTHHVTVRTVGIFFGAYESATEGDSFILAFASATDAAQFALGLQRALLAARWPEELLTVPGCAPVYVRKLDWLAKANQVSLVPAPTRRLGSRPVRSRSRGADASGGGPRSLRFASRNIAAVLGVFAGHPRARPHLQHAPTSKRSVGSAHAAEASAGLALPPAPGGFSRTGSAPPGHGPGLAGLGAGLLSRRWTSRRTSNDQAAIAAAMAAEEAAAQEGEGQGAATQEEDGMGPTAEEEELDAEVAAAVEAAAAAADPSQHGRATGGAAAGNRHLLGRFWAAMDAGGRPMQPMTSMRRRRRRSDTSLVAMMAAPYLERQSVPGHGDDHGDGGAGTPGGTGTGPGAAITDGTRKRSLRKFAMHGRQSVNVRGSPDLHVWSPGAGGGPLGGAVSLPTSPDDNPDNSMYGGRGTPRVGDGGRRARLKSIHHASVTFAAVAVAAISGSRAHDTGGGGGGAGTSSDSPHRPGRIRRASLAISNLLGIGSGATSGPGSPASTGVADAVSGPDMALTPRQLSRHARRGSVLNTMLGTVTALGSPAAPGTGTGSAVPAAGTTDGGLTFTGATAAGVEGTGDAAPAALITCGSAAPPTAAASGSPHSRRLRRASLALTSWLGLGHPGNATSGSHTQVATGSAAVLLPVRSRRASSDAIGATTSAAYHAIPAAVALMPASKSAAGKAAPTDLVRPSPTGAPTDARYPAGAVVTEATDSPHAHINSYSVVALSAALAASEYKAAAVAGADSTQLTGSIVDLPEPLTNSGLEHPSNASGPRARLLAGRALPGSGLPAEEVPPDALAAAAASPILTPAAPSPQATAASSGVQPPLGQARGRRASSFVPRLLNLALFEVVNGSSGGGGGPISTSGSGGGNAPRSLKSQGSQMRRRYSTVLERALSPRGKSMAGNSAAAAAVSGGGSGGGGLSDAATPEQAAVPGVSTWGSELGVEDGAEKWAELKWQMSGRRTGTVDAPAMSSGGPRAFGGGAGATSGTTSRHSNLLTSSAAAAAAAGAAIAASSSTRPKLDIARVFSIAHMQDSSLPIAGRTSAANTGTTVVGAGSVRGGPGGTGGIDGLDFGRASPVPALSGGASPLFPPGLPPGFQDAIGIAATEGQQVPERKLAAAAAGLGLPSMSGPQGRSSADSGGLPTRRTAPDMPHVEQLLGTPLQHSHSQPVRQHPHPPREQHHQQERRVGPPQLTSASTCLPAPVSGTPSPMPPSQQSRTGAVSAMGFSETADAALADERWSLAGVIIGTGGASGQVASSSSLTAGATPPMVSAEPAQPRARNPAVPLSLLLPADSSAPGVAGIVSSAGGESLQLALRGSVGGGAEASACTAGMPLPQRPARTFGPVFSPQPPAGSSSSYNVLRQAVADGGGGMLPMALQLQMQQGGAQQTPAGSPSTSQLQQAQPVRSSVEAGPLARLLARTQAPPPLLPVSPRHTSPPVPGVASPGHHNPTSSVTNPNTPSSAAGALSAARSSTAAAAAAAALHRRFSELAVELAKPVARARSQAASGGTTRIAPPDQAASPRRGGYSITAGGSGMKPAPATLDRSHTFNTAGGEAAAAGGGSGGAGEGSGGGGATAALAAVVAGALKFGSFSRRSVSSGPRVLLPRSQHGQHFLTASGGADSTGSNGSGNAAAQSLPDGTQSATLPHLSASGAAAAAASQSGGSSRMARLEYTSSRRRVGAGMEPLERLEEETGGATAQTVPLPQAHPQSPSASPLRKPPPRLRSSGAVAGTSADGNEQGLQPSAAPETGHLTPKGARGKSDGGGGGGEARVSKSGILPSALQLLLKRSGTGGSSRKAGAGGLLHLSDAASTESADLLSGEDGSGHGRVPKSPARLQLAPRAAERDVPSAAFAPRLDLVEMTSVAGDDIARPSGAGEAFGSAIVPLAEPPRAHSAGAAGGVGVAAGSAALGFVKPSIIIPLEGPSMAALPQPFAHDQPALMSPDATAAAASVSFAAPDTATSNIGPGPQHTEPLHTAPTNGMGRVGSITMHVPAARAVKPPTHGSLLELLHRVFVRVDGTEAAEGHKQRQNNQQHQQQRPADMQLVFAGLRVRVGLHCGVTDARDIQYNAATARMTFGGEGLRIAKAVCDCASGGQVVMSGEVLLRLQLAGSGGVLLLQQQQMLLQGQTHVLDLGDHQLLEAVAAQRHVSSPAAPPPEGAAGVTGAGMAHAHQHNPAASAAEPSAMVPVSRHLLCIAAPALLGRMAVIPPVRSALHQFTPGFMDAPVGPAVCVVVFRVSNAAALAAWNAAVASEAMALLELYLRASLGALINTSNTSGSNGDQAQPADSLGPQSSGRGGAASTPNRLACYLAAAPPGSPFGTFVAGFSQPAAAARWALTAVARTAELPWPAELLDSQWGRPLDKVTRAEAEAVTGVDATASGATTPLKFVRRRASRYLGAGASGGSGGGAKSSSRHRLPNVAGAAGVRSVPTSPLFGSMPLPPAADTAGPCGSTPPGSRAGGGGSSCDGGTTAGTAAGSSFRSNRSGPLFGRVLQRSSSSRMTPSLATGGHHSDRGTSAAGTPLPAALGSGGGGGGLSTGRNARARSAFGGTQSDSPSTEAMGSAARASYSKSDVGGLQGTMKIRASIYEGGESAVELIPLETMESEDDFEAADEPSGLHQRHPSGSFSTLLKTEPWTSAPPPSNEDSGRGPTLTQLMPQRRSGQYGAAGDAARAVTGRSATAGGGKGSIAPHVAGLMHARLSAPQPVVLPRGYGAAAGRSSARSRTGAGDALLFPLAPAAAFNARNVSSAHSSGTPSGFPQQPSRLAPNALQYPAPGASAPSASGACVLAPAPSTVRAGSASTATTTAFAGSSTAVAAASAFASAAGPAVLALAGSIPEDETTHHSLDRLQERLSKQQRSAPIGLVAVAALSALTGAQQPPLHEVLTAAAVRQPFPTRASMASPLHAEITPAEADENSGGPAAASTVGRLSDAVSCPVAALTQQREASGALESMYSGTSGFSRLGTMGRRLDDVMPSPEASGMLRSLEAARAVQEGAVDDPGLEAAAGGRRGQQLPQEEQQQQRHTRPRTDYDIPRRASLLQLRPAGPNASDRRPPVGSGRGSGAHDSKSTMRRLHARMLRTLATSFSDVGLRRKIAASKSEIAVGAGRSEAGAAFASGVAADSAGGSSSRASGKRLSSSTVTRVARLASPAYSTSNGGRAGHEPTSPLMSTAGTAGLDARHFGTPSQQGRGSSGANSGFRALQVLVGNRRVPQTEGRELSAPGLDAHGRGVLSTPATAPSAAADVVAAAAARAEEDAEVVSFRGLRVRLGMAVGPVAVQLCPLTGRVVYSGKTVSAAASVAASARLGTMYVTQEAAEALSQGGARLVKLPEPEERPRQSKSLLLLPVSVGGSLAVDQKPSGTRRRASALSFLLGVRPSVPAGLPLRLAGGASMPMAAGASQQSNSGAGQHLLRLQTHNTTEIEQVLLDAVADNTQQQQQQQQQQQEQRQQGRGNVSRTNYLQQPAEGLTSAQQPTYNSASITANLIPALTEPVISRAEAPTISAQLVACAVDPQIVCTQITTAGAQGPLFRCRIAGVP